MNNWLDLLALGLVSAMLTLTAVGLSITIILPSRERWSRRFFMSLFATIMLCMLSALVDLFVWETPNMVTAEKVAIFFEYLLLSIPIPMFTAYLLHTCGEEWQRSRLFCTAIALWVFYFVLLGIAQFTTFLYYITPDNQFHRGSWHPLLLGSMVILLILNLAGVIQRRNSLPKKYYRAFLTHLLPMTAAFIAHTFFFVPMVVFVGVVFSTLSMFTIIIYDQIDQYMRQQREISHQRASIMVLQMRPHFIYNAMMSIYYLCTQDPQKAQQVTLDFTTYLRRNFTAIASENTVPFADELEHTRAYLAIEQVQFVDGLLVEFDTPHKEFRVPPLTLQPIVENSIKHGMDPESTPLCISIRTRETPTGSEIIVEDNGSGFAPADGQGQGYKPHIALENIRERIKMMCDGELTIQPRAEGGTVVRVSINR